MTRPLRLLFAAPAFPRISETFVTDQIIGLHRLGHRIDVFTPHTSAVADPQLRCDLETAVERLRMPPGRSAEPCPDCLTRTRGPAWQQSRTWSRLLRVMLHPGFRRLRYPLRKGLALLDAPDYDAIVCHFGPAGVMVQQMRDIGLLQAPLATVFHGYDLTNYLQRIPVSTYDGLFARGDLYLPISERWRQRLKELGCPPERTRVHRLGTDLSTFTHAVRSPEPDQPLRLLSVARLVEKKGIEFGIRAVAHLVACGVEVVYDVVGDGPLKRELEQLSGELATADRVKFLGARSHSEVAALMREHHVLLVPSVTDAAGGMEGIPVAIMEAMASGLLVVASRHSGIPEIVRHEENGLLAAERDDRELAVHLAEIRCDADRWRRLVLAALETVLAEYDLRSQNEGLAEILSDLAGSRTSTRS